MHTYYTAPTTSSSRRQQNPAAAKQVVYIQQFCALQQSVLLLLYILRYTQATKEIDRVGHQQQQQQQLTTTGVGAMMQRGGRFDESLWYTDLIFSACHLQVHERQQQQQKKKKIQIIYIILILLVLLFSCAPGPRKTPTHKYLKFANLCVLCCHGCCYIVAVLLEVMHGDHTDRQTGYIMSHNTHRLHSIMLQTELFVQYCSM